MKPSRAEILALRRELLVLQSQVQRLQLRHDTRALADSLAPAALANRLWQKVGSRPSLGFLALLGATAFRRAGTGRMAGQALVVWRVWRALRRGLSSRRAAPEA